MSDHRDLHEAENLDQIYSHLRWPGVELAAGRIAASLQNEINAMLWRLELTQQYDAFQVTLPDEAARTAYLEAANHDLQRAVSLARWGIPPELAAQHPNMPIYDLARLAHQGDQ